MSAPSSRSGVSGRDDRVEVLHGWGEGANEIEVLTEAAAERAGVALDATADDNVSLETKRRFLTRDPPDLWVEWPGPSLEPYANVDVLRDVSDVWTRTDVEREFHDAAADAAHVAGAYRALPLNINRVNHLYYNLDLVEAAGVDPGRIDDPREFVEALAQVEDATDADGLIMAFLQPFASEGLQLWEALYLGQHGPSAYRDLLSGEAARRRDEIREGLSLLDTLFAYANDDAANLIIDREGDRFCEGEAAFRIQGMWGVLDHHDDFAYGTDWDHVPVPGTGGSFLVNMDALVVPSNPPHPEATDRFLEAMGSSEGIETWSQWKQAIPPRTDVSLDGYDPFVREQIEAFERASDHLPSMAHGLAVRPDVLVDLEVAFSEFVADRDVDATTDDLVSIFESV